MYIQLVVGLLIAGSGFWELIFRRPHVKIVVAVLLVILGIWKEIFFESNPGDNMWMKAHIGMVLFALNTLARHLPSLYIGLQLADDAERRSSSPSGEHSR